MTQGRDQSPQADVSLFTLIAPTFLTFVVFPTAAFMLSLLLLPLRHSAFYWVRSVPDLLMIFGFSGLFVWPRALPAMFLMKLAISRNFTLWRHAIIGSVLFAIAVGTLVYMPLIGWIPWKTPPVIIGVFAGFGFVYGAVLRLNLYLVGPDLDFRC